MGRCQGQQDLDVQAPKRREVLERRSAHGDRRREDVQLLPRPEDGVAGDEQDQHGELCHRRESDHCAVPSQDRQCPVPDGDHQRQDRKDGRSRELQQESDHDGAVQGRELCTGLDRVPREERWVLRRQGEAGQDRDRQGSRSDRRYRRTPVRRPRRDVGASGAPGEEGFAGPGRLGQARDPSGGLAVSVLGGRHHESAVQQRQEPASSGLRDRPPDDPEDGLRRAGDRVSDQHVAVGQQPLLRRAGRLEADQLLVQPGQGEEAVRRGRTQVRRHAHVVEHPGPSRVPNPGSDPPGKPRQDRHQARDQGERGRHLGGEVLSGRKEIPRPDRSEREFRTGRGGVQFQLLSAEAL